MIGIEILSEEMLVLNMALLLILGGACSLIFKHLRMPVVIGYLIGGIIIAHFGWNTENTMDIVEMLSDIGLVMLMFCIGMELNIGKLKKMGSTAVMTVLIMVPIILIGGILLGQTVLGLNFLQQLIFAAVLSGSSTAVFLIVQADQKTLSRMDLETLLLVLVVEDVVQVIILSAISPLMQGTDMSVGDLVWMMLTIVVFIGTTIIVGIAAVPRFLDWVRRKMPSEVLVIISLGFCFGLSYLSVLIGMSMAIGAFLAGVVVSQAKSSGYLEEKISPMKDVFMMMFFVSIGLQISVESLIDNLQLIAIIYFIFFMLMFTQLMIAFFVTNKPLRLSFKCTIALMVMGEFAFIISKEALNAGIFSPNLYTSIVGAALMSMIILPIINRHNDRVLDAMALAAPASLRATVGRMEEKRMHIQMQMGARAAPTVSHMTNRLAMLYITIAVIVAIQVLYFLGFTYVADFIDVHTPAFINRPATAVIVLLTDFIILLVPVHRLVRHVKYFQRLYLNGCRIDIAAGRSERLSATQRFVRLIAYNNPFSATIIIQFGLTMAFPVDLDSVGRLALFVLGMLMLIQAYGYSRVMAERPPLYLRVFI